MPKSKKRKTEKLTKDSPFRSLTKAVSWRLIATLTTFLITFIIFKRYTDKTYMEVFETASFVAGIEVFAKLLFYYLHERLWQNIRWGTALRKDFFQRRAWKKIYREMHRS